MKSTSFSLVVAAIIIAGSLLIVTSGGSSKSSDTPKETSVQNVSVTNDIQTIEIKAKGGYWPRKSVAKAGIPTVLRINTGGTYDCSAAIRIPSLAVAKMLPPNGSTDIDLGTPEQGKLNGTCGMGMYNFQIDFQ